MKKQLAKRSEILSEIENSRNPDLRENMPKNPIFPEKPIVPGNPDSNGGQIKEVKFDRSKPETGEIQIPIQIPIPEECGTKPKISEKTGLPQSNDAKPTQIFESETQIFESETEKPNMKKMKQETEAEVSIFEKALGNLALDVSNRLLKKQKTVNPV